MTEEFERIIRNLGELLHGQVESELAGREWVRAFLDVRFEQSGGSWLSKIRAECPNGESTSVKMSNEIDLCLISLNSLRNSLGEEWYGLMFTITAGRRCDIQLNYDPECSQDTSFYDS